MHFRVLGSLEVLSGDRLVPIARRKQRELLALLILHAPEPVSADRLVDELWPDDVPATARGSLHNYVSQLRGILGAESIVTRGAGYALDVEPDQIDIRRFRRLAGEARLASVQADRVARAREALSLWRGPALSDLAYEPFAVLEQSLLEDERLGVYRDLFDAELELGAHARVLDEIEALVHTSPYDERLRRQLMLALYRDGRQADALAAYQEARRVLVDDLGLEPGRELRSLHESILNQSAELDLAPRHRERLAPVRKTVTVVSAGLHDEGASLDPEALHLRRGELYAGVKAAADYHGGVVERAGDAVMAVFGLPVSREDDSLRAVRAAIMVETAQGGRARLGIATGEVYAERHPDDDVLVVTGAAVTTARRLEQQALPGEILLGASTVGLLRGVAKTKPVRRGGSGVRDAPFRLLEIIEGEPANRRFDTPLVNRVEELAELRRAFDTVRDERRCRAVTVLGEAGIGKTRLAQELISLVRGDSIVLVGRCVSYGEGATYMPLAEMLRDTGADLDSTLADASSSGEEFVALRRHLSAIARERAALLVFEDIHWAEPTLLDFIEYLADQVLDTPLLVLCLARPELLARRSSWPAAMRLGPLDRDDTVTLVRALGEGPEPELERRIVGISEGNPLYAEQLLAYAGETGVLDAVPLSLEALLASRLDRLGHDERHVLQRGAIVGREFSRAAVASLCSPDVAVAVEQRLESLAHGGFLDPSAGEHRFHHVLMRDVAYAGISKAERAELHERLADWLEPGSDELVGHHLEQATLYRRELDPADRRAEHSAARAGARLGAAGLRAWRRGDAPAAVNLLSRGVALLAEKELLRLELMCELGVALRGAGELKRAETVLVEAAELATQAHDRRFEYRARLELANVLLFSDPGGRANALLTLREKRSGSSMRSGTPTPGSGMRLIANVEGAMRCRYGASAEAAVSGSGRRARDRVVDRGHPR